MARDHARISVDIWSDPDWKTLEPVAQLVYIMLTSSPDLSYCGIHPLVPERLATKSSGMTGRRFRTALATLAAKRFVVVDETTAEILVRSYVRHDGVLKVPNVAKAMVKALARTHSTALRGVIVDELVRAQKDNPDAKGWHGVKAESPELFEVICGKAFSNPSGKGSVNYD